MPNLRSVLRAAPDPYLLLALDLTIVEASDAYLAATQSTRDQLLGRDVFDVFPDSSDARVSVLRVLDDRKPHERSPVRGPGGDHRFWRTLTSPVIAEAGHVSHLLHRAEPLQDRVELEHAEVLWGRCRQLVDHAPDAMVIVGQDSRIRLVNLQTETLFGYTREELNGQPLEVLIPERFRPTHGGHMTKYFASPLSRPMGARLELFGRRKDGSELPIEVSLSPQVDEHGIMVWASIRDITERRRFEADARLAAARLHSAVDSIQDAFALFDAEDRLIMCNSVFRRLMHRADPERLVGKSYTEILEAWIDDIQFPDEEAREHFRQTRLQPNNISPASTFDVRLGDGRALRVSDRRTAEGGIVKTVWDITDDERRASELRDARSVAETASAAKSEFLSSMSHELRTPLNAVLGFAQLLIRDRRDPLSQRHRERVEHILSSGEHLLRLIDDVLDLSRIEAGGVSLSIEPVTVGDVLSEVSRTLEPIAMRQKVQFEVLPLPDKLPMVMADRTRFAQILMNFGSNAVKYNHPSGHIRFAVTTPSSDIVRVTVTDTGIGIPLDKQTKLFQPFQRAGQEAGPIEGTGIGLMITKRLAEMMDGKVGFTSVSGEGSDFWVDLPAKANEVEVPSASPKREPRSRTTNGRHLVLCVEDNPANIMFMHDVVSTLDDIELVTVPTAELGIEFARARHPALVLMDINLPGMSGLDALRVLQADEATREIRVIALTAAASARDRERGIEAGFYRYLSKPVNVDELLDAIDSVLDDVSGASR